MGLVLRKNLNRPLTSAEVDGNFTFLNIDRWQQKGYSKGQIVYNPDILTGDNVLYTCLVDHDSSVYTTGFVTAGVVNGIFQTIWLQIASSGGLGYIRTITGTTLMGVGVAAPIYAGMTGVTHQFRRIQSMNGNITISYDDGTVYLNASGATVPAPVNTYTTSTPVTCYGLNDGTLTVYATGGTGNRRYSINNGVSWYPTVGFTSNTSHTFTGLAQGSYTGLIKVQDQILGLVGTPTGFVGGASTPLTVTVDTTLPSVTGYTDGIISFNVSGGNGNPYFVRLYSSTGLIDEGDIFFTFTGLTNDNYQYYIYDSNQDCGYIYNIINLPAIYNRIKINTVFTTQAICYNGVGTATINLVTNRGSGNFRYKVNSENWSTTTTNRQRTFNGLSVGQHILYAQDVLTGEIVSAPVTIENSLSGSISGYTISTNSICSSVNANVLIRVKNVAGNVSVFPQWQLNTTTGVWNNFLNYAAPYYEQSINFSTTSSGVIYYRDVICGIVSGATYSVIKTNPIIATQTGSQPPNCPGDNWSYTYSLTNGSGTFEYSLNNSTWFPCTTTPIITVPSSLSNTASTAIIYFRDAANITCTTTSTVNNTKLRPITGTTSSSPVTCSNLLGSITLTATGGFANNTSNFEYRLVTNGVTGTTYTTMSGTGTATATVSNLTSGVYNFVINRVGSRTCGNVLASPNVTITVPQPLGFTITSQSNPTSCGATDGSATVQFTGGTTSVYDYKIGNGTWQTNGGVGYSSPVTITGLSGSIKLFVRDHTYTSCATSPSTNNIILTPPSSAVAGSPMYTRPTCNGDLASVTLTVISGSGNYRYWYNGTFYPSVGTTTATSYTFTAVTPFTGSNSTLFKIVDGSCDTFVSVTGTGTPSALSISSATGVAPTSAGGTGSIVVNYAGGTPNFVLSAISGSTTYTSTSSSTSTGTITGIAPGNYIVSIYDNNGTGSFCSFTYSSVVNVPVYSAPPTLYFFKYTLYSLDSPNPPNEFRTTSVSGGNYDFVLATGGTSVIKYRVGGINTTLSNVVNTYLGYGSAVSYVSVTLPTTPWGATKTASTPMISFTTTALSWSTNQCQFAIMVPVSYTSNLLTTGLHISDTGGSSFFNAKSVTTVTYGGTDYYLYSLYSTVPQASNDSRTIQIYQ